jgi:hypothetical protein
MDRIGLEILHQELLVDARVLQDSARLARQRLSEGSASSTESCGYHLNRFYNVLERGFERVCESFENHFEKRGDYHEKLIQRMTLSLPGIRPALYSSEVVDPLRELKGFRHIFRHAYDLSLSRERLEPLVQHAEQIADDFPARIASFVDSVQRELEP